MPRYGSLFERLNGDADARFGWGREACTVASVADHLAKMLSTREGSVGALPDYGLPDFNRMGMSLHDALSQARDAIERFVSTYEPRLSAVNVRALPREDEQLRLSFCIEGLLELDGVKQHVSFTARLDGSGQVKVK